MEYINPEQLSAACKLAAESLNIEENVFKRAVFDEMQKQYDREDIITWLDEQGYAYNDDDVEQILSTMRDDWDSDRGTWSNIESAYYNNDMHLPYVDDKSEEPEDDDNFGCQIAFPQCQKCKVADECDAYQHALKAQAEAEQMGIPGFEHDTFDCETFEPFSSFSDPDDEFECKNCSSHCPNHADCPTAMERVRKLEEEINNE